MEALEIISGLLGVLGLILIGIGRWMLIDEVSGMSWWWRFSARCVPLADLLILSRFWDTAKNGAFTALTGMVLLLPYGAFQMYKSAQIKPGQIAATMSTDMKASIYEGMKQEHFFRIQTKQEKCAKLNQFLGAWYQSMQSRRALLGNARPGAIAKFNEEAAAYSAFRSVVNEEARELAALQNQPYEFGDIKNEDYEAYEAKQAKRYAASAGAEGSSLAGNR